MGAILSLLKKNVPLDSQCGSFKLAEWISRATISQKCHMAKSHSYQEQRECKYLFHTGCHIRASALVPSLINCNLHADNKPLGTMLVF